MEPPSKKRKIAKVETSAPQLSSSTSSLAPQKWSELPDDIIRRVISPLARNSNARLACKSWARSFRVPRLCIGPTKARKTATALSGLVSLAHRVDVHTDTAVEFADLSMRHVFEAILIHFEKNEGKDLFAFYSSVPIAESATLQLLGKMLCHPNCTLDTLIFNHRFTLKTQETTTLGPSIKYLRVANADHFHPHPESRVVRFCASVWNNAPDFVATWSQSLRFLETSDGPAETGFATALPQFSQLETLFVARAIDGNAIAALPKLRVLTYGSPNKNTYYNKSPQIAAILKSPSLEVADFSWGVNLTDVAAELSFAADRLTQLSVCLEQIDGASANILAGFTSLKRLELSTASRELPSELSKLTRLEKLTISFVRVAPTDELDMDSLSGWLKNLPNLRSFNLGFLGFARRKPEADRFFEALQGLSKLETLAMSHLDPYFIANLANVVRALPALRSLDVRPFLDLFKADRNALPELFAAISTSKITRLSVWCPDYSTFPTAAYTALCNMFKSPSCKIESLFVTVDTEKSGLLGALIQYGKLRALELMGDIDASKYPAIQKLIGSMPDIIAFWTIDLRLAKDKKPPKTVSDLSKAVRSRSELIFCSTESRNDFHFYPEVLKDFMQGCLPNLIDTEIACATFRGIIRKYHLEAQAD